MSNQLVEKIRAQRQFKIPVGRFTFTAKRPTESDVDALVRAGTFTDDRLVRDFVVGWEGVIEDDIVGGGGSDPVKFHAELWREWSADHREFWEPIALALAEAIQNHRKRLDESAKNSQPGSS